MASILAARVSERVRGAHAWVRLVKRGTLVKAQLEAIRPVARTAQRWAEATGAARAIWQWAAAAEPVWVAHRSWDVLAAASTSHPCGWVAPGAGGREKGP